MKLKKQLTQKEWDLIDRTVKMLTEEGRAGFTTVKRTVKGMKFTFVFERNFQKLADSVNKPKKHETKQTKKPNKEVRKRKQSSFNRPINFKNGL